MQAMLVLFAIKYVTVLNGCMPMQISEVFFSKTIIELTA
jgi:hypothetical protein